MDLPNFGQNQNQNQYYTQTPQQGVPKKKIFLFAGGILALLIALVLVLTSGNQPKGQPEMRAGLQATADALGIIDEYESELSSAPAQNDVALVQILLRGNFQSLNELFNETYKPKDKFSSQPKPDDASKEDLDRSKRANTLDDDIISALEPKVAEAQQGFRRALPSFSKKSSKEQIQKTISDLNSINDILNKPR